MLARIRGERPQAKIDGVLVQRMESGIAEVIVGFRRDRDAGPLVMVGVGGILAELGGGHAVRLAPVTLEAALELSRRLERWEPGATVQFRSPQDVAKYFGPSLRDLRKEVFVIAFLNARKVMIGFERISVGGQTATVVDPAEVMRQAILHDAHSIIALHNHPSGNARASDADLALTRRLIEVGHLMGIALEDHVIIAGSDHLSLRMQGGVSGW
jgi:DNA repair protein RadC